jgi:hypothetical protein
MRDAEGEAFEGRKDGEFFRGRDEWLSSVRRPRSNLGSGPIQIVPRGDLGICTSKLGHLGLIPELKTAFVPQGHLIIARRFIAGVNDTINSESGRDD